jgi:hypothetical protein
MMSSPMPCGPVAGDALGIMRGDRPGFTELVIALAVFRNRRDGPAQRRTAAESR